MVFKTIMDGTYKPGQIIYADLASGGIDLVLMRSSRCCLRTSSTRSKAARQQIIDGKLKVLSTMARMSGSSERYHP